MSDENSGFASPLREATTMAHELYTELRAGGFNERQAIMIVIGVLTSGVQAAFEAERDKDPDDI